jgi:hypothetical protein
MVSLISHGASGRRLAAAAGSCSSKRRGGLARLLGDLTLTWDF